MFMNSEEMLITYNEGDWEFQIDSGKLASSDLGVAEHEYRDVQQDVTGIVTTPELVTQYLHGTQLEEF